MLKNTSSWWLIGSITWALLFFLQKTNLAASDLGRHIKNGEVILNAGQVFSQNLYSYTNADFYAPNHHWLFGVIAYAVHQLSGFSGLTVLSAVLYTASIAIGWIVAKKRSSSVFASITIFLALPLFAHRSETRPEAFSLFFFALLWMLWHNWLQNPLKKISWKQYVIPLIIMIAWVNIHIFFILAIPILGAAAVESIYKKNLALLWSTTGIAAASCLATFINPFGITLTLYPFQIFSNYGYRVSENQSLWFFLQHYTQPYHWYLLFFILLSTVALLYLWIKKKKYSMYLSLLLLFFGAFTVRLIRMENVLALVSLPIVSEAGFTFWKQWREKILKIIRLPVAQMVSSVGGFTILALLLGSGLFIPFKQGFGVGLYPGYEQSLAFIKQLPLDTPIFNNFDSGSFLIYALYPSHKVFIDNRAEAYPADFLQSKYIKAQENEQIWQEIENQYHFGAIIFYRQENTNWGQEFLVKRIQDSSWVPIYVDNYLIIFLKDIPENQPTIEQYRLPSEMFSVTPT